MLLHKGKKINIAVFASGGGSNAREIIKYFKDSEKVNVCLILTNNPAAGVIKIAKESGIPCTVFSRENFRDGEKISGILSCFKSDFIILAGFLWMVPGYLLTQFKDRIINIHPSLLPRFGGKGMYGHFVHEAVKKSGESVTGMTIHVVNEKYDEGKIIFQAKCNINPEMSADEIASEVLKLEHKYYPQIIDKYIAEFTRKL